MNQFIEFHHNLTIQNKYIGYDEVIKKKWICFQISQAFVNVHDFVQILKNLLEGHILIELRKRHRLIHKTI